MGKYIPSKEIIISGMLGKAVGDALGVPVEFEDREKRVNDPVCDMRGFGTYGKPAGTWSDDTSMALAAMASIVDERCVNFEKIMQYFILWYERAFFTTDGDRFDCGGTIRKALETFKRNGDIITCGPMDDSASGNGSLMRILPFAMYYADGLLKGDIDAINNIAMASGLTHNSLLCREICIVYSTVLAYVASKRDYGNCKEQGSCAAQGNSKENINGIDSKEIILQESLELGLNNVKKYCENAGIREADDRIAFIKDISRLHLIDSDNIAELPSDGYVLDSFRAAFWCFMETDSYKECVLKAVNLGKDTDTTAAIAGALAGIYYTEKDIPKDWKKTTIKTKDIITTCEEFYKVLMGDESPCNQSMLDLWSTRLQTNSSIVMNGMKTKQNGILSRLFLKR